MIVFAALLLMFQGMGQGGGTKGVLGDWIGPTMAVLRVYPCGNEICVKLLKISPKAPATVDVHNPEQGLRSRPLCGLEIGSGFRRVDENHAADGHLYDPISGRTYKGTMTAEGSELRLRGYMGIPVFGRTETWHRVGVGTAGECGR